MNISTIRIFNQNNCGEKLLGVADITLENMIAIHGIKIVEASQGRFLAMPWKTTKKEKFKDVVHPINKDTREIFEKLILGTYEKVEKSGYDRVDFVLKEDYSHMNLLDLTLDCYEVDGVVRYETDPFLEEVV